MGHAVKFAIFGADLPDEFIDDVIKIDKICIGEQSHCIFIADFVSKVKLVSDFLNIKTGSLSNTSRATSRSNRIQYKYIPYNPSHTNHTCAGTR